MALTKVTGHVVKPDTNIQFHNTKSTGIVTFAHTDNATSSTTGALQVTGGVGIVKDLFVGGNVTVGGTITYDDVTNIDSLGIITARTDIHLGQSLAHLGDLDTKITFDTNIIKFDTAGEERIRIRNDGHVGIGTDNPGRALTIKNSEPRIRLQKPNLGHGEIYIDDDNSINLSADSSSSVGSSSIIFRTNGAENVRIKENKVGIRTDNPTTHLHVRGHGVFTQQLGSTITNGLFLDAGDTGQGNRPDIILKGSGSAGLNQLAMQVYYNNGSDKAFHLRYDGGTYHVGNIGIGTESPDRRLHILGTGNAIVKMEANYSGSVTGIEGVLTASGANRYVTGIYGKVVNTSGTESNVANIRLWNEQASPTTSDSPGYITFNTTNNGANAATEKVRITSGGNLMVGNGADTPYAPLHVYAENNRGLNAIFGKGFVDNANYHYDDANVLFAGRDVDGNDTGAGIEFNSRTIANNNWLHGAITQDRSGNFNFITGGAGVTAGTMKVIMTGAGKVGIGGTTIPTQVLDVIGNIRASVLYLDRHGSPTINMTSTSDTGGGSIYFGSPASGVRGGILYDHDGDKLKLRNIYGTSLEINNARKSSFYGDIHMFKGSGEPNATLSLQTHDTVNSTATINLMARDNSNVNETCSIQASSGGTANVDLIMSTGAGEVMRLKRSGEVHISDRNSSNTGDHFFQAGAFGIRMEDTGGYNRWNIERNYGGYQSVPLIHLSAQGRVGINKATPDSDLHIYNSGGAKLTLETADNADAWINFSGNSNEMSFGFDKSDNAMILANNDGIQNDRRLSISNLGHVNIGQGIAGASETVYIRWDNNTANRSYSNGGNEGFVINTNRRDSNNYEGVVDLVAGRGSDNNNGGTRFRIFAQPRNTSVNRMIMDLNGTKNHVRMGNTCIYSYGDQSDGEFGSGSYTHYDHKVGSQITHNDFTATRARDASGGDGYTGGIEAKQTTNVQSFVSPYRYTLSTPNSDSNAANTYYPVSINTPGRAGGGTVHTLHVGRRYYDSGPAHQGGSTIGWTGSSTHQGGLDLFLQVRDSAWSDMYDMRILHYRYTYHQTVGGWGMFASSSTSYGSGPFYLMLRGGFQYKFYANYPLAVANVQPGGRVYSTAYAWYWPNATTSTSGPLSNFASAYYAGTA